MNNEAVEIENPVKIGMSFYDKEFEILIKEFFLKGTGMPVPYFYIPNFTVEFIVL